MIDILPIIRLFGKIQQQSVKSLAKVILKDPELSVQAFVAAMRVYNAIEDEAVSYSKLTVKLSKKIEPLFEEAQERVQYHIY